MMIRLLSLLGFLLLSLGSASADQARLEELLSRPTGSSERTVEELRSLFTQQPELLHYRASRPQGKGKVGLLVFAIEKGDYPLADLLLSLGADPNRGEGPGARPPLQWVFSAPADEAGKLPMLELLLARGADVSTTDSLGRTVVHALVEAQEWRDTGSLARAARLLKESGAPLETEDSRGFTPLLSAVMRHDPRTVGILLELGADPASPSTGLGIDGVALAEQQIHTLCHPVQAAQVLELVRRR